MKVKVTGEKKKKLDIFSSLFNFYFKEFFVSVVPALCRTGITVAGQRKKLLSGQDLCLSRACRAGRCAAGTLVVLTRAAAVQLGLLAVLQRLPRFHVGPCLLL